jgi:hypothetical protein
MYRHGLRVVTNGEAGRFQAAAEIHIFEPDGPETLVEAADALPYSSRKHKESAGGLFDETWSHRVHA